MISKTDDVFYLVAHHETGGDERTNLLKEADTISYFDINLPLYYARHSIEETKRRVLWGYKKLSPNLKEVVAKMKTIGIKNLHPSCILGF